MILAFFGLRAEHKPLIHNQLFEMVYYGHGFTWSELYDMPIWLRKFYYKKIEEAMKASKKKSENSKSTARPKIQKPSIRPKR